MTMIELLDHGYVKLIETWGSDERIIEAARMSTSGAFKGWGRPPEQDTCRKCGVVRLHSFDPDGNPRLDGGSAEFAACAGDHDFESKPGDEKLLAFLWNNKHATPFEMAGAIIEVQAPIFVFREWHRHRTQSYNELSARYTPLPDVNYVPFLDRCMIGSDGKNRQAGTVKDAAVLTEAVAQDWMAEIATFYDQAEALYQKGLKQGLPKELARVILPVGRYSRMRASANLRNWLGFLTLRMDKAAQWEIRQYAYTVHQILKERFPRTLELFDAGRDG